MKPFQKWISLNYNFICFKTLAWGHSAEMYFQSFATPSCTWWRHDDPRGIDAFWTLTASRCCEKIWRSRRDCRRPNLSRKNTPCPENRIKNSLKCIYFNCTLRICHHLEAFQIPYWDPNWKWAFLRPEGDKDVLTAAKIFVSASDRRLPLPIGDDINLKKKETDKFLQLLKC